MEIHFPLCGENVLIDLVGGCQLQQKHGLHSDAGLTGLHLCWNAELTSSRFKL